MPVQCTTSFPGPFLSSAEKGPGNEVVQCRPSFLLLIKATGVPVDQGDITIVHI